MNAFEALGDRIARDWRDRNHDNAVFPALATQALREARLSEQVTAADVAHWLMTANRLPSQSFRKFGEPPINVYTGHKFYIEVIHWLESTTAIHQHGFSGAFAVLSGSSVHSEYTFECREQVSPEMLIGRLALRSIEQLGPGDVREIRPGGGFIHSLFHLETPSLSVVVRSYSNPFKTPQYSYSRSGLACDPFFEPEPMMTQLRLLESLVKCDKPLFESACAALLRTADFWLTDRALSIAYHSRGDVGVGWQRLEMVARERHGHRVDALIAAYQSRAREHSITSRRATITDPDHRYFLALLLNAPHRDAIYQLLTERHPGADVEALVVRWVRELSEQKLIGLAFEPLSLRLFQFRLRGLTVGDARAALVRAFSEAEVAAKESILHGLWAQIEAAPLLAPLLARQDVTK